MVYSCLWHNIFTDMEQTIEVILASRQEFASALLDQLECIHSENHTEVIIDFCDEQIYISEHTFSMRILEFSVMGFVVKRKLKHKGLTAVISYLEMLEDVFTDCKVPLN